MVGGQVAGLSKTRAVEQSQLGGVRGAERLTRVLETGAEKLPAGGAVEPGSHEAHAGAPAGSCLRSLRGRPRNSGSFLCVGFH